MANKIVSPRVHLKVKKSKVLMMAFILLSMLIRSIQTLEKND